MNNKHFGLELERRTQSYAILLIRYSSSLPETAELRVIKSQVVKSGSSIGANYREANKSRSKADFYNKIKICQAESNETIYWLEILKEILDRKGSMLEDLISESKQFLAIFTTIANKLKNHIPKSP